MQITLLGLVLIPLALIWAWQPVRLLELALIASVFEAAAAIIVGGFGLQPSMVPGLLFVAYVLAQYALGMRYPAEGRVLLALLPLLALLACAILSAWLLPGAFAGRVLVFPQKADPLAPGFVLLQPSFGNTTQTLYLAINVAVALTVAVFTTRAGISHVRLIRVYLIGGYLVIALVFWQLASRVGPVPFPETLLYSNPSWAVVSQDLGSVPRMQGPFAEPAGLAFYLSGLAACCAWLSVRGVPTMRPTLLLALSILAMLLSTSTTGIVVLLAGLPLALHRAAAGRDRRSMSRVGRVVGVLAVGALVAAGPILLARPQLLDQAQLVVQTTLSKGDSDSYTERTGIDAVALEAVRATYGLGVGWGSFRSSSLLPGLLANAGVAGPVLVLWLVMRLRRLGREAGGSALEPGWVLVGGFAASLCGQLAAAVLSAPMIGSPAFFLQLGCVVGVLARMAMLRRGGGQPGFRAPGEGSGRRRSGYSVP